MGTSWNKRHATTITGVNGDAIDRSGMQKAHWVRYDLWKQRFLDKRTKKWTERLVKEWKAERLPMEAMLSPVDEEE